MVLALDTLPRKLLLAAAAAAATVGLSIPLWSHYQVNRYSSQGTRENLEQAVALQPENAELRNRLGRVLLYSPLGDGAQARVELERATQFNARTAAYWTDLAMARELANDLRGAGDALQRAQAAEPRTPAVLWHRVNFMLRRGDQPAAQKLMRELLQLAPEYTDRALPLFSRVTEPGVLITQALPSRADALEAAMDFVRREDHIAAAGATWNRVMELHEPPSSAPLRAFLDWLIQRGQSRLAQAVWKQAALKGWIPMDPAAANDAFYNADFQSPLQNFGFDWRVTPHPEASVWMEGRGPEPGQQSLCVQFAEGARSEYSHVFHFIAVEADAYYSLRATLRSDRLFSRSGGFLEVRDSRGAVMAQSDSVSGTSAWKNVALQVQSGSAPSLLRLALRRPATGAGEEPATGLMCMANLKWELVASKTAEMEAPRK